MKVIKLQAALKQLKALNREISYKHFVRGRGFTTGLVSFNPARRSDPRQINHPDKDVVCQVLKGRGRLRVRHRTVALEPGMICHIPKGTPHDFAATEKRLILLYSLITTG
jgi:mannose-6-phosphate isomerase-like protein (cupin superfamily)